MPFPSEENIWFFKLSALILNTGGLIMTHALREKVKAEQLTFPDFLDKKKHDVYHLFFKRLCCLCLPHADNRKYGKVGSTYQWEFLYVKHESRKCHNRKGNCCCVYDIKPSVNEDNLDISLKICLLVNLFQLYGQEKQYIEKLREQRNTYFAHTNKASIDECDFIHTFDEVALVLKSISIPYGISLHNQVCKDIEEIKDDPMRRLGYQMIINWINQSDGAHARVLKEDFEKAITKVMDEIKKHQMEETKEKKLKGHLNLQDNDEILRKKVEKKLSEIKFHSVHGVYQKKKTRLSLSNSFSLPQRLKDGLIHRAISDDEPEYVNNIHSLKSNEMILLLEIMEACRTRSKQSFENKMANIPEQCQFLRAKDERGYRVIHYASERTDNSISFLKVLINHGANLGDRTSEGMTVLHIACKNGNVKLCQFCLSKDPDLLNLEDCNGWNAMLFASFYGNKSVILFLRKNYSEVCIKSGKTSVNILHLACLSGNSDLYTELQKTYPEIIREKDNEGRITAHYAARGGNKKILKMLITSKWVSEELNTSEYPRNILQIACRYSNTKIVSLIISEYPFMLHESDDEGFHAVHYAAFGGNVSVMRLLMEFLNDKIHQCSINCKNRINILQTACVYGKTEMWKFIAQKLPNLLSERDDNGWLIQHVAARCGNLEVLKIIVEDKNVKNINSKDVNERTILHVASLYAKFNVCEYLVSKFPDLVKERDEFGCPACVLAARGGNLNAFKLLHEKSNSFLDDEDRKNICDAAKLSNNDEIIMLTGDSHQDLTEAIQDQTAVGVEEIAYSLEEMESSRSTDDRLSTFSGCRESLF